MKEKYYVLLLVGLFVIGGMLQLTVPKRFVWEPSFLHGSEEPFGCAVFDTLMATTLAKGYRVTDKRIVELTATHENVLIVTDYPYNWVREDTKSLFAQLEKGAKVMIVSDEFDTRLCDTLGVSVEYIPLLTEEETYESYKGSARRDTLQWVADTVLYKPESYRVRFAFLREGYLLSTSENTGCFPKEVLAWFRKGYVHDDSLKVKVMPVALCMKVGHGELYLVRTPRLFSNYGVLDEDCRGFVFRLMNRMKNAPVVRTEAYGCYWLKDMNEWMLAYDGKTGILGFIHRNPPLRMAFLTALFAVLVLMAFTARRKQRPIPVMKPPVNRNLEFVKLIGSLCFQRETPCELVRRKYSYFSEEVKERTGIDLFSEEPEVAAARLAERTGISVEQIQSVFDRLNRACKNKSGDIGYSGMVCLVNEMNKIINAL